MVPPRPAAAYPHHYDSALQDNFYGIFKPRHPLPPPTRPSQSYASATAESTQIIAGRRLMA